MKEELREQEIITRVIEQLNMPKLVRLHYLEDAIDKTIDYVKEVLYKLTLKSKEDRNDRKIALDVLSELIIRRGLNNIMYANENLLNLLRVVEKKRCVLQHEVSELLKVQPWSIKSIVTPLITWKILQRVTLPTLKRNHWARGYGWYGDTIVHDYLLNKVYNIIHSCSEAVEIQPSYAFSVQVAGREHKKVSDGKIAIHGRNYLVEILTNVDQKPKEELEEQLLIYGEYMKNSKTYFKQLLVIVENKKARHEILCCIRKQNYLRKYFEVFHFSPSEMNQLENLIKHNDPFYGQKNIK